MREKIVLSNESALSLGPVLIMVSRSIVN